MTERPLAYLPIFVWLFTCASFAWADPMEWVRVGNPGARGAEFYHDPREEDSNRLQASTRSMQDVMGGNAAVGFRVAGAVER